MHRGLFTYHPTFGYHFIPRLQARIEHEAGGYLMRTNAQGFRCRHDFVPERRPGSFRILLFGDSYTAGDGVSDQHRYGDVLEKMLGNVEVYNFGMSGTGTDQQYLMYRELGTSIEHDLVVIAIFVENVRRVTSRYRLYKDEHGEAVIYPKPYFTLDGSDQLHLHQVPVPRHLESGQVDPAERAYVYGGDRLQSLRLPRLRRAAGVFGPQVKERIQRLSRYQPLPSYGGDDHPDWQLMRAILRKWTSDARSPVLIVPLPTHFHVEGISSPAAYQQRFQDLHDPPRVVVHDPLADFRRLSSPDRRRCRFAHDPHFTPQAHDVVARSLADPVRAVLGVDAGAR